jgi:hypothetical protein
LPVAEFHKKSTENKTNFNKVPKPIHPFADKLMAQGLLLDTTRGVTSSSARREIPSSVFGISTPGPLDPNGKEGYVGYDIGKIKAKVSRLGGSTFVMDDGDKDGKNELVRIRTRTGHQILLHTTDDLIYIANSKGTAWIELTSNGKIDIFAEDSISIHSSADFNFRADRDINLEAGRNVNIKSVGSLNCNVNENMTLIVGKDGKLQFTGSYDHAVTNDLKITAGENFHLGAGAKVFQSANGDFNISSGGENKFSAAGNTNLLSGGLHKETASAIHMNGASASAAGTAIAASTPSPLAVFSLPARDAAAAWENSNFYKASSIKSIMQRVPMHEPWDHHENTDPTKFTPDLTDNNSPT